MARPASVAARFATAAQRRRHERGVAAAEHAVPLVALLYEREHAAATAPIVDAADAAAGGVRVGERPAP